MLRSGCMRVPPQALLAGGLVLIAAIIGAVIILAGGDDDDPAAAKGTPTPTRIADDDFGPRPTMTGHIVSISPSHGETVQNRATRPGRDIRFPAGICAEVSYENVPQNNLWFHMAVDGRVVTDQLYVFPSGPEAAAEGATLCYAPDSGLEPGLHDAAVVMRDPNDLSGPPTEIVGWKFEVIP
jgi:hypothetical protein